MKLLAISIGVAALAIASAAPGNAQVRRGSPGDGERAYEMGCALLWMGGNLAACRELPWHPCRNSNPNRPSACDGPRREEPHPTPRTFDDF